MSVTAVLVAFLTLSALVSGCWLWIAGRIRHQIAEKLVSEEMAKLAKAADSKIKNLPDPDRPFSAMEVQNALRELRDLGRKSK